MQRPRKYPPELLERGARLVFESGRYGLRAPLRADLTPKGVEEQDLLPGRGVQQRIGVGLAGGPQEVIAGAAGCAAGVGASEAPNR
jgi:hypothetical protein